MSIKPAVTAVLLATIVCGAADGFSQGPEPGRRWALVVAVEPAGPAHAVARALRDDYGYVGDSLYVLIGESATLANFYSSLNKIGARLRPADSLLVYVSARTVSLSRARTSGEQIAFRDGNEREPWTLLGVAELIDHVRKAGAGAALLVVDDCVQVGFEPQFSPRMSTQQARPPTRSGPLQIISGCPAPAFSAAFAAALAERPPTGDQRRVTPRDLVARMTGMRKDLRASASGEGPFAFERVASRDVAISRLDRSRPSEDRQRAINEFVQTALNEKAPAATARTHATLSAIARDRSDDVKVRTAAVRGLGLVAAPGAERELAEIIRDEPNVVILSTGISALERLRTPAAIAELERAIDAPVPATRAASIRALGRLESARSLGRILEHLQVENDDDALIAGLEVAPVLSARAPNQAVSAILQLLRRQNLAAPVETAAVGALGLLRFAGAEQTLAARVSGARAESVRAAAAVALSGLDLRDGSARERVLVAALKDKAASVRESAAFALGRLKARGAAGALRDLLSGPEPDERIRAAAATALGDIGASDARGELVVALTDPSPNVRRSAAAALGKVGDRAAIPPLRQLEEREKDPYVRSAATNALRSLSVAVDVLMEDLRSADPDRRRAAVVRLASTNTPEAVELLVERLGDVDGRVASAAVGELSRMTAPNVTAALIAELSNRGPGGMTTARRSGAATALGARRDPRAFDALLAHVHDEDLAVRAEVIVALGGYADPRVMDALMEAAATAQPQLRRAAADALTNYGNTLYEAGRPKEAIAAFEAAMRLHIELFGTNDVQVALDLNNLGVAMERVGRFTEAEDQLQAALRIREEVLGPVHPDTATSLVNLGLVYARQKDYARAEPLYLRGLSIRETALGPDDASLVPLLEQLATMYAERGLNDEAARLRKRALAIRTGAPVKIRNP